MRRSILIVVALFVIAVSALWVTSSPPPATDATPDASSRPSPGPLAADRSAESSPVHAYTRAEVARHATARDCWIIIHGVVYDVTSYIDLHPAPADAILRYAGQDATTGWDTKDRDKPHSARAARLLERYRIGIVKNE